jgi:hypothetical protein
MKLTEGALQVSSSAYVEVIESDVCGVATSSGLGQPFGSATPLSTVG